ncbi:dihydroorotate dehydrogenase electron transfer subunit [Bhargavaea ginsengi]|uniref:Dihydroorotate dehydrogenase B (NAD(+)), electron transfer subunit n=1 Tax=Bhargavaea ginsengi TaxID=426757 RepID=A0A1H6STJ8_9BACL|nr:dihydroorotate dehydrogenase electron transfer subunit [Bhargavaea ginsengi]SEI71298.1 dihydroorotate dehydrogenase electron transfer subunit [Bhargavaea ginsengi]
MIRNERMKVAGQREIARNIYELVLEGELAAQISEPGRFVHVRAGRTMDPLLRRPISIADYSDGKITLIYRAEGYGTRVISEKGHQEEADVLGPLGNGFPVGAAAPGTKALLVGGGIGVPPLYGLSKRLKNAGVEPVHVLGFQSEDVVFYEEEFSRLGETHIATVDGTRGTKGFVTDVLASLDHEFSVYYSCGPLPMLKAVAKTMTGTEGYLSFEERMGCGIGACFACVCHTDSNDRGYVKVCSDGPVFKAGVVTI